jgi:hypothetical protein
MIGGVLAECSIFHYVVEDGFLKRLFGLFYLLWMYGTAIT